MKELARQDRNGTRTTTDIERRYRLQQLDPTIEDVEDLKKKTIVVDSSLSATSLNPVENRVITTALNNKVNAETGKGLIEDTLKTKLENIEANAQENVIESISVGGVPQPIVNKTVDLTSGGVTGDTLPIGSVVEYSSDIIPLNWLLCDGQAVSRIDYSELFNLIGTTYGSGDGSTTFNLPNYKGRVSVGKDTSQTEFNNLGKKGGEKTHTLTVNEMPSHTHNAINYTNGYTGGSQTNFQTVLSGNEVSGTPQAVKSTGGGQSHNNLQPYITSNYIIKAKQSAGVVATVVDNLNSTSAIDALSANQGRILKENQASNYLLATITTTQTISSNYVVNLENVNNSQGNKFSLVNGKIKIGAGVNKIRVSGSVFIDAWPGIVGNYLWARIYKNYGNSNSDFISGAIFSSGSGYISGAVPPIIVNVQENDEISIMADSGSGGKLRTGRGNTWLLVEEVR